MAIDSNAPRGCTNFKLRQLLRSESRLYDAELARAGLKTTQYSLLSHLLGLGPVAPGEPHGSTTAGSSRAATCNSGRWRHPQCRSAAIGAIQGTARVLSTLFAAGRSA